MSDELENRVLSKDAGRSLNVKLFREQELSNCDYVELPNGGKVPIPKDAVVECPLRGDGIVYKGKNFSTRIMYNIPRVIFANGHGKGQPIDYFTGKTLSRTDPLNHLPFEAFQPGGFFWETGYLYQSGQLQ